MNHYFLSFIFTLVFLLFSCEETKNSNLKKEPKKVEKTYTEVRQNVNSKKEISINNVDKQETSKVSTSSKVAKPSKEQTFIAPKVESNKTTSVAEKKEVIPARWKYTYSKDKKWMDLYVSSRTYFLNGWNAEFERNIDASISKDELLLAYRKRMENIFYETPSFIEFCVQEMKVSPEFESFCQKWNENVK